MNRRNFLLNLLLWILLFIFGYRVGNSNIKSGVLSEELAETKRYVYVSPSGNNTHNGSLSSPWKTIQYAVDNVKAGDTIYVMGGTYPERVILNKSGADGNPITLKNYNGQTVTINGLGLTWGNKNWGGLVSINGRSNWVIDGINLQDSDAMGFGPDWIEDTSTGSSNVTIKNCSVTRAEAPGIEFKNAFNIIVDNCIVTETNKSRGQEGISFTNVDGFEIMNCQVIDSYKEFYDVKDGCRNGSIHDCKAIKTRDSGYPGGGFYVDAFSKHQYNIELYGNTASGFFDTVGFTIGVEAGGSLENILFRNNLVYDSLRGYNLLPNNDETYLPYSISDIVLRNNVAFDVELTGAFINGDLKNITIENNILFSNTTSAGIMFYDTGVTDVSEFTIRNNFFRDHNSSRTDLPTGTDFKTLQQLYGVDNAYDSVFKDATGLLTGTRDFSLVTASPAEKSGHKGIDMGMYGKYPDGISVTTQVEIEKVTAQFDPNAN